MLSIQQTKEIPRATKINDSSSKQNIKYNSSSSEQKIIIVKKMLRYCINIYQSSHLDHWICIMKFKLLNQGTSKWDLTIRVQTNKTILQKMRLIYAYMTMPNSWCLFDI